MILIILTGIIRKRWKSYNGGNTKGMATKARQKIKWYSPDKERWECYEQPRNVVISVENGTVTLATPWDYSLYLQLNWNFDFEIDEQDA